jgi:hypothetical protein
MESFSGSQRRRRVQKENAAVSGANLFGIEAASIQLLAETVLDYVNVQHRFEPLKWDVISRALANKGGPSWAPSSCQRVWKFIAYGEL